MRRVLCYGDPNTWGYEPATGGRFPRMCAGRASDGVHLEAAEHRKLGEAVATLARETLREYS